MSNWMYIVSAWVAMEPRAWSPEHGAWSVQMVLLTLRTASLLAQKGKATSWQYVNSYDLIDTVPRLTP